MNDDSFLGLLILVSLIAAPSLVRFIRRSRMKRKDYAWYRAENPDCCTDGGTRCFACGASRISVRGLMRHTYMREHFCSTCGQTLFFSPEGR